jgi:23S rRNA (uracil1939-C5)-methyltransferase
VRVDNLVIFVSQVAPGDVVDLRVTKAKKSFLEAVPVKFHSTPSSAPTPFCQHFGVCGGCKWQHLTYDAQLHYKQQQVIDQLTRIGKVALPEIPFILPRRSAPTTATSSNTPSATTAG